MIRTATFRGHTIRVITIGDGPFRWRYSLDDGECTVCEDAEFNSEETALGDGLTAAKLSLDRLHAQGSDAFEIWEQHLHG